MSKGKDVHTTARLTILDIARDAMSTCDTPTDVVIEAANTLWLHKESPSFLFPVIVEVDKPSYMFGSVHRLSDDVAVKSLVYALWKSKRDANEVTFKTLIAIAMAVPLSLRYQSNDVDGWFARWLKGWTQITSKIALWPLVRNWLTLSVF